jgi:NADH:ubiquinone oxidoreductase subunit
MKRWALIIGLLALAPGAAWALWSVDKAPTVNFLQHPGWSKKLTAPSKPAFVAIRPDGSIRRFNFAAPD